MARAFNYSQSRIDMMHDSRRRAGGTEVPVKESVKPQELSSVKPQEPSSAKPQEPSSAKPQEPSSAKPQESLSVKQKVDKSVKVSVKPVVSQSTKKPAKPVAKSEVGQKIKSETKQEVKPEIRQEELRSQEILKTDKQGDEPRIKSSEEQSASGQDMQDVLSNNNPVMSRYDGISNQFRSESLADDFVEKDDYSTVLPEGIASVEDAASDASVTPKETESIKDALDSVFEDVEKVIDSGDMELPFDSSTDVQSSSVHKQKASEQPKKADEPVVHSFSDDEVHMCSLKGVPEDLVKIARARFPDASNNADAVAAYIYYFEGKPLECRVTSNVRAVADCYEGEQDTLTTLKTDMMKVIEIIGSNSKETINAMNTLLLGVSYLLFDRLGFRKVKAPDDIREIVFDEKGVSDLMESLQNATVPIVSRMNSRNKSKYNFR